MAGHRRDYLRYLAGHPLAWVCRRVLADHLADPLAPDLADPLVDLPAPADQLAALEVS
jgi:hypothetical protein